MLCDVGKCRESRNSREKTGICAPVAQKNITLGWITSVLERGAQNDFCKFGDCEVQLSQQASTEKPTGS